MISAVGLGLGTAAPAAAHPYFLASRPAPDSVVASAPSEIDITFTEALDYPYSKVVLTAPDGQTVGTHQVPAPGPTVLAVVPDHPATGSPRGTYVVGWTAVGADGHTVIGSFAVSIGHVSAHPRVTAVATGGGAASGEGPVTELLRDLLPAGTIGVAAVVFATWILDDDGRRRARRAVGTAAGAIVATSVAGLTVLAASRSGWAPLLRSATGTRLLAQTGLVMALAAVGVHTRRRRAVSSVVVIGLVALLAASGHASAHHRLVLLTTTVHLLAVAVWAAAILAVLCDADGPRRAMRRLQAVVGWAIAAVVVTGVATTRSAMRHINQLAATAYGRVVALKVLLLVAMVVLGVVALKRRRFVAVEAGVGAVALLTAGVLGQLPQPVELPSSSQLYAAHAGLPVSVGAAGGNLIVGAVTPGLVGRNRVVVEVGANDRDDFLRPATGVDAVTVQLACACAAASRTVTLHQVADAPWWQGDADLPTAATWSLTAIVGYTAGAGPSRGGDTGVVDLVARIEPASLPDQIVVGVPADLSGPDGAKCQDEAVGLQIALADVNSLAVDHGDLVRVVAVDTHDGVDAAMARLASLHPSVIALPCGSPAAVAEAVATATRWGVPTVADGAVPGAWSIGPDWGAEGRMLAAQAQDQGAKTVTVVAGVSAADQAELAGVRSALTVPAQIVDLPTTTQAAGPLLAHAADAMIVLAAPAEAAPLTRALSDAAAARWAPRRGLLASSQLMDTRYIDGAGQITRVGGMEIASVVDPFDPVAQYYAQRLRQLVPGLRPSFDGVRGYTAGLVITRGLVAGGGHPRPGALAGLFATRFSKFTIGSYRGAWGAHGGQAGALAFFRSTYLNPMAMPSIAPGGAGSLAHEGTFLNSGGFEQVAPFKELS